jgi:hypothetical protein
MIRRRRRNDVTEDNNLQLQLQREPQNAQTDSQSKNQKCLAIEMALVNVDTCCKNDHYERLKQLSGNVDILNTCQ